MLYGSLMCQKMEREYESRLDAGDYEDCDEDCQNCKFYSECEYRKEEDD